MTDRGRRKVKRVKLSYRMACTFLGLPVKMGMVKKGIAVERQAKGGSFALGTETLNPTSLENHLCIQAIQIPLSQVFGRKILEDLLARGC